jgi:V/A-type H+-transporting ATPase subunit C
LLRNLKTLLKGKALALPEDQVRAELIELDPRYQLPTELLLRATSFDAALDLLEATPLRHWIRGARRFYERDPTLFGLDAALDRLYYPELWQQMQRLDAADRSSVRELIDLELDQVNLLWLLRYRLNYRLSPAETYYLLVPVTGHIPSEQLKQMVREETLDGVAHHARVEWARRLLRSCRAIWQVEAAFWRHRVRRARQVFRTAAFTLGEALALLVIKVAEVRDLIAVLQANEIGAARSQIEEQLASMPVATFGAARDREP